MDAAKLESLGPMVEEVDGTAPGAAAEAAAGAARADQAHEAAKAWGMVAYAIGGALSMIAPELREVYTEDACIGWGHAMVPVAAKYGWDGPSNMPELGLAIATIGLAAPSFLCIRRRMQARKAAAAADLEARTVDVEATPAAANDAASGGS